MKLWRISEFAKLSGDGGLYYAARWNEVGYPIVYCCDHPSTSLLEIIAHIDREDAPSTYQLLEIETPDALPIFEPALQGDWFNNIQMTQMLGTAFLTEKRFPLMRIPSVIMPQAFNYLLNPAHPDAAKCAIARTWRYPFDSRLLM